MVVVVVLVLIEATSDVIFSDNYQKNCQSFIYFNVLRVANCFCVVAAWFRFDFFLFISPMHHYQHHHHHHHRHHCTMTDYWSRVVSNNNAGAIAPDGLEASGGDSQARMFQALPIHADSRGQSWQ